MRGSSNKPWVLREQNLEAFSPMTEFNDLSPESRSRMAEDLLNNPVLAHCIGRLRQDALYLITNSDPSEPSSREAGYFDLRALDRFEGELKSVIVSADAGLEEMPDGATA
jgi:hypothetical protein